MPPKTTVSFVIPCYNSRETIAETVASALAQRDVDAEVIVVDDGSTDDSRAAIGEAGLLERVQWITQPNGGVSRARNRGLDAARGAYICFLDGDDILDPAFAVEMVQCLQTRAARFAYCDYRYFADTPARPTVNIRYPTPEGFVAGRMLSENFIPTPGAVLLERAALGGLRFDPARQGTEDWWLWMQLCLQEAVCFHPSCLVQIRVRPGSLGRQKTAMIHDTAGLYDNAVDLVRRSGLTLAAPDRARFHYRVASAMVDAGRLRDAMGHWATATRQGLGPAAHAKLFGRAVLGAAGSLRRVERLLWHRRVDR